MESKEVGKYKIRNAMGGYFSFDFNGALGYHTFTSETNPILIDLIFKCEMLRQNEQRLEIKKERLEIEKERVQIKKNRKYEEQYPRK